MKKLIILSFFLCINIQSYGQEFGKVIIDLSEGKNCWQCERVPDKKSDTTNYYIFFEDGFRFNNIRVNCNDSLIFEKKIKTEPSSGLAAEVLVGSIEDVKKISIRIDSNPSIIVYPIKDKGYVRVRYIYYDTYLCFSKYPTIYY